MKKTGFIALSALLALMIVGCGSAADRDVSNSDTQSLKEPIIPTVGKFTKADWTGVQPLAEDFFITDDGNLLSFKVADENIANGNVRAMGVFIDADNNPNTGYSRRDWLGGGSIGADYLVGDRGIYSYGGEGWSWNFIQTISRTPMNGNELEFEFPRNLIQTEGNIRVLANLADQNWNVIKVTEPVNYTLSNDNGNGNNGTNSYTMTDNGDNLLFTIQSPLVANNTVRTQQLFIDTDNNPNTGYRHRAWGNNIGVEYLIEGNHLYHYTGSGTDWSWEWVRDIPRDVQNDTITLTAPKNLFANLNTQIRTIAGLRDQNWHMIHMYDIESFTLEGGIDNGNNNNNNNNNNNESSMRISHTLNNFFFTIHNDNLTFNDDMHAEYYIDRDNDPNTGFSINGIGAEYRIANNQVNEFREWGEWGNIYNHNPQGDIVDEIYRAHDIITNPHRVQLLQTGRHISVVGRVLDEDGNEITITDPTPYEVTGDNEEITFSLEDPDYYIFRIHSDLIRMEHYAQNPAATGFVHTLHLAIDADNDIYTGNSMNGVGADYWTRSDATFQHTYRFVRRGRGNSWIDWWDVVPNGDTEVVARDGLVEIRIPRSAMQLSHRFSVASTFNQRRTDGRWHFYWTNRYEFEIPQQ